MPKKKIKMEVCEHDYKNAIRIGNIDYVCPVCKKMLDPMEWFLINYLDGNSDVCENALNSEFIG